MESHGKVMENESSWAVATLIKHYNGKVLTVNGFYALKCIGTHLYQSNSSGHKPLGKTEIPNSQLGICVIPTSPEQGISI